MGIDLIISLFILGWYLLGAIPTMLWMYHYGDKEIPAIGFIFIIVAGIVGPPVLGWLIISSLIIFLSDNYPRMFEILDRNILTNKKGDSKMTFKEIQKNTHIEKAARTLYNEAFTDGANLTHQLIIRNLRAYINRVTTDPEVLGLIESFIEESDKNSDIYSQALDN